jgi:hypothetical protein
MSAQNRDFLCEKAPIMMDAKTPIEQPHRHCHPAAY